MKNFLLLAVLFVAVSPLAQAQTVKLEGEAAESFLARHFPYAEIPGPVEGIFHYVNRNGLGKQGYAECFVPAMGGRSNGEVSSCVVEY